jgi:hypothetical protein
MKRSPLAACLALFAGVWLTGCAGIQYIPPVPELPRASGEPLPLRVGIVVDNPNPAVEASGFAALAVAYQPAIDLGAKFAEALRDSRLFQDVRYPIPHTMEAMQQTDLVMNASFKRAFRSDPAKPGKAIVTGMLLLLPVSFITYDDNYTASGRVAVDDRHGNWIKEYSQTADLTAQWKLFSEARSYKEGPKMAAKALVAQLVEALLADRELFEKFAKNKNAAAPAPKLAAAEPPASVEKPAEPQAVPAPVEASPAPKPVEPPKPKKPLNGWDDQLLP